jgi:hypothetical protein
MRHIISLKGTRLTCLLIFAISFLRKSIHSFSLHPPKVSPARYKAISMDNIYELEEMEIKELLYPSKNTLFQETNVILIPTHVPKTRFLDAILPKPTNVMENFLRKDHGKIGVDVSVEFPLSKHDEGARKLVIKALEASHTSISNHDIDTFSALISKYFEKFEEMIESDNPCTKAKARIVSSRGSIGQKCPRWHVDHVPLRLVVSLVGPGCVYIPHENEMKYPESLDRSALNGLDVENSEEANNVICPKDGSKAALKAKVGDAVFLMGRAWETLNSDVKAAPHMSPTLKDDQPRVLLTVDVVPNDCMKC